MESAETWLRIERTIYSIGDNFPYWFLCLCTWFFVGFWIWVGFKYSRYCWLTRKYNYYRAILMGRPLPQPQPIKKFFNAVFMAIFFVGFLFFFIPCMVCEFLGYMHLFSNTFKLIENLENLKEDTEKTKHKSQYPHLYRELEERIEEILKK